MIRAQTGMTMVELLVALAIGSFLMIGAVQIYNQSRQAFVINDSIARVQETAQFAMDTIENDMRMASNWGRTSRALSVEGRSILGDKNPRALPEPNVCGDGWALDIALAVDGENNSYTLPCLPQPAAQLNSDIITVRRATVAPVAVDSTRLQIQTTRIQGEIFSAVAPPATFSTAINPVTGQPASTTHNLLVSSYYVANNSDLIPGTPTLRRKRLTSVGGAPTIVDEEIAPGVENIQIQLGVDVDADNTVDRYVSPGEGVYDPNDAVNFIPGARVITARIWLLVRGVTIENGVIDPTDYEPGDVDLGTFNDSFRRMMVSKTILLRNART
ncbi:MAG: PilW family protein [Gammaproteobacteria bacterium]|nr:PilW family protein [Gammaproteobacteria bacterium]